MFVCLCMCMQPSESVFFIVCICVCVHACVVCVLCVCVRAYACVRACECMWVPTYICLNHLWSGGCSCSTFSDLTLIQGQEYLTSAAEHNLICPTPGGRDGSGKFCLQDDDIMALDYWRLCWNIYTQVVCLPHCPLLWREAWTPAVEIYTYVFVDLKSFRNQCNVREMYCVYFKWSWADCI